MKSEVQAFSLKIRGKKGEVRRTRKRHGKNNGKTKRKMNRKWKVGSSIKQELPRGKKSDLQQNTVIVQELANVSEIHEV